MYELVLTRVWSVTLWYHFAFVAISLAMFGLTVGALIVYLLPDYFEQTALHRRIAENALLLAVTMVVGFLIQLCIPMIGEKSLLGLISAAITYGSVAIPFCFSGVCIALVLSRFPENVSKLYAADLLGAACGCILVVGLLQLTDGPTSVFAIASLASLGALLFAVEAKQSRLILASTFVGLVLALFSVSNTVLVEQQRGLLRLPWIRGLPEPAFEFERWNAFSRVTVFVPEQGADEPFGWGLSELGLPKTRIKQRWLSIDGHSATVLTNFAGDVDTVKYLKWDVTNLAHHLRSDSKVLIVGAGGGRDILSALAFGQKSVVAVEINDIAVDLLKNRYAEFTGHLDRVANVKLINDEARSYIARHKERYNIIELSLIDTGTASASGAFALAENSLYTQEAWKLFLERLEPNGILTCTRWYAVDFPGEIYRLVGMARAALASEGVANSRAHLAVVRYGRADGDERKLDVATVLVSKQPFTGEDLDRLESIAREKGFKIELSPRFSSDKYFSALASGSGLAEVRRALPARLNAPTDDSPFFFYLVKPEHLFDPPGVRLGTVGVNSRAPAVLMQLLVVVIFLTILCIALPLALTRKQVNLRADAALLVYFGAIGAGFMLIEMSQLERLIIVLGHPTYSLTVVLFTVLLFTGLGSYFSGIVWRSFKNQAMASLGCLLVALILFAVLTPSLVDYAAGAATPLRILLSAAILAPLAFLMGTSFPLGLKLAGKERLALVPWLWGINGATSVCASVLALAIAIVFGIAASYWTGFACYFTAFLSLFCVSKDVSRRYAE